MVKIRNTPPPWQVTSNFFTGLSSREASKNMTMLVRREVSRNG